MKNKNGDKEKMFSKQHFEKIANLALNSPAQTKTEFVIELAKLFQADNPRFKTQKFFDKSGLNKSLNQKIRDIRVSESNYLKVIPSAGRKTVFLP